MLTGHHSPYELHRGQQSLDDSYTGLLQASTGLQHSQSVADLLRNTLVQLPRNSPLNPMAVNIVQQDDRSEAESLRSTGGSQARQAPQDQDMRTHRGKSDSATTAEVKDQEGPSSAIEKPLATSATNGQSTGKRRRGRP